MRAALTLSWLATVAACARLPELPGTAEAGARAGSGVERAVQPSSSDGQRALVRRDFAQAPAAAPIAARRAENAAVTTAQAAPSDPARSPLMERAERLTAGFDAGESAHWLLDRNSFALDARLALTDTATRTLDIQYFIWQGDASGTLLARRLLDAADRGVAVRLLLDDFGVITKPSELVHLDAHDDIEVRTFNPWAARGAKVAKAAEYLRRVASLNNRMHNKTFIADGAFAIVGGRNIGDRYFGIFEPFVQNDLDLLAAGPLTNEIAASFELYWESAYTYPVALLHPEGLAPLADTRRRLDATIAQNARILSSFPLEPVGWDALLMRLDETAVAGRSELYLDSPEIENDDRARIYAALKSLIAGARSEVLVSSPYFVPDAELLELMGDLTDRGVRVALVTNSLATNNHVVAHTGYKRWRRSLLELGVEVYELRADAEVLELYRTEPVAAGAVGLHTKAVVIDGRTAFVGSPNIDPRSMIHNTEIAAVVSSEPLARELRALIERDMQPENAWRVTLDDDAWLTWSSGDEVLERQPARGFGQRVIEFFLGLLPLKKQI